MLNYQAILVQARHCQCQNSKQLNMKLNDAFSNCFRGPQINPLQVKLGIHLTDNTVECYKTILLTPQFWAYLRLHKQQKGLLVWIFRNFNKGEQ